MSDLIPPIPPHLRAFKSEPGASASAEVHGDPYGFLIWSEPVGERLVVVFTEAHPGNWPTIVAILTAAHVCERLERVRPYDTEEAVRAGRLACPGLTDDDEPHTIANKVAIARAQQWVAQLREQAAPGAGAEGEAWLRQQLSGLGQGAA